jgi:hypothetical protein
LKQGDLFQKIGQHPSVADFQIPQVAKYRKLLGDDSYREFTRGIRLAANGVGIGSFVYLRRIFENLIEEAHIIAKQDTNFDEGRYRGSRMDEKIAILRDRLPPFLVKNRNIYSVLSKGIHELTEAECLDYFRAMRVSIELILDEKLEAAERKRKIEEAEANISKIDQKIRSGS